MMRRRLKASDWEAIVKKAIEQAKDGDSKARDWLAQFIFGGKTIPDATDLELDELVTQRLQQDRQA